MRFLMFAVLATSFLFLNSTAKSIDTNTYWMKIPATTKEERTRIANTGVSIEIVGEDYVIATGNIEERNQIAKMGLLEVDFPLVDAMDFPEQDAAFHNYAEMLEKLQNLHNSNKEITSLTSIGKTVEGRDIWAFRISGQLQNAENLPASVFMGGHHAREHLSIELPIYYVEYLLQEYNAGNARIRSLVDNRDIHFIPMVNPDGAEFDISTGRYKSWRKNRSANSNGTFGVDLNRNYGFGWGGAGASTNPGSDTYRGTSAFSENESLAIKNYVEAHTNITILLSFHTFSELILYPWGHVYESIGNTRDKMVHEEMAKTMARWNGYTPQKSSDLYIASGDTTDWSYGEHRIISFTFELDPKDNWRGGGFYPGAGVIPAVQRKNLEPVLYLIDHSANPYRVIDQKNEYFYQP